MSADTFLLAMRILDLVCLSIVYSVCLLWAALTVRAAYRRGAERGWW